MEEKLTAEEIAMLTWESGRNGDFINFLWEAIFRADIYDLEKLRLGFPDMVNGFKRYCSENGWWHATQEKAKRCGWKI